MNITEKLAEAARGLANYLHSSDYGDMPRAAELVDAAREALAQFEAQRAGLADGEQALPLSRAANDVLTERQRQISAEGWAAKHDDEHSDGSMALAAACYACNAASWELRNRSAIPAAEYVRLSSPGFRWPWTAKWWKPKSQRQDLIRAAALILAEIERLDRAEQASRHAAAAPWLR